MGFEQPSQSCVTSLPRGGPPLDPCKPHPWPPFLRAEWVDEALSSWEKVLAPVPKVETPRERLGIDAEGEMTAG